MSQYFPKFYERLGGDINVTMDSSNYASKTYFKKMQQVLILLN